jgi:P27 family predicted phage terminase small subunit
MTRKPKSLRIQIAEGDPRKHGVRKLQELAQREPQPERGLPSCPDHLQGIARDAWHFWSEQLAEMKIDNRPDAMMLEGACVNYARAVRADALVNAAGETIEEPILNKEGVVVGTKVKKNPAVEVANAAWRHVRGFCSDFGFSPAARTRISLEKPDTSEQDFLKLLSEPRLPRENRNN